MQPTPLTIGITGHRDIPTESIDQITSQLIQFFQSIKKILPNTPILLISGLADGADRIAAHAALTQGISVEAVLPMPVNSYLTDFSNASTEEFKSLLLNPNVTTVELLAPSDVNSAEIGSNDEERTKLYQGLGDYLIAKSSLLLSLWDGKNLSLAGGTSDVVMNFIDAGGAQYQNTDELNIIKSSKPASLDFCYWLPVDRSHSKAIVTTAQYISGGAGLNTIHSFEDIPDELEAQLKQLDNYNLSYQKLKQANKLKNYGGLLSIEQKSTDEQSLENEFLKSDELAIYNQSISDKYFKCFSLMAGFMGVCFLLYAKILAAKVFLIIYLSLFIIGFFLNKKVHKSGWFTNHLEQRVIAETLRIKFYLSLSGNDNKVKLEQVMDKIGVSSFTGFNWLKFVFRSAYKQPKQYDDKTLKNNIAFVTQEWLEHQAEYFAKKAKTLSHRHHKLERIKNILLLGSALAALALIIFKAILVNTYVANVIDMKTLVVFFMGLLPLLLGIWEIHQSKMAIKELLWQYQNQAKLFKQTLEKLSNTSLISIKQEIIAELAEKALIENYLWTIQRYHREHEPPVAG